MNFIIPGSFVNINGSRDSWCWAGGGAPEGSSKVLLRISLTTLFGDWEAINLTGPMKPSPGPSPPPL